MDIFRQPFSFRIGRSAGNTTLFSLVVSSLVILPLLVLGIIFFLVGVVNRTTPHINVQEMEALRHPIINLNQKNYRMGFSFQAKNGSFIASNEISSYFDVKVGFKSIINSAVGTLVTNDEEIEFKQCQKTDYVDFGEYYDLNLRKALCIKNHEITLQGYWDESKISFMYLELRMCKNDTNRAICKSKEEILEIFRGGYFYLHTESQNVNSLNYERPLILTMKAIQFLIDPNFRSEVSLYMQKMVLSTYDGLIYNANANTGEFYKQTYYTTNSMSLSSNETLFWSCLMLSSTKILTVERYYNTLIEVAGIVGGISRFLILLGFFLTARYNGSVLVWNLIKESFNCEIRNQPSLTKGNPYLDISLPINKHGKFKIKKSLKKDHHSVASPKEGTSSSKHVKITEKPEISNQLFTELSHKESKVLPQKPTIKNGGMNINSLLVPPGGLKDTSSFNDESYNPPSRDLTSQEQHPTPLELEMINIQFEEGRAKKEAVIQPIVEEGEEEDFDKKIGGKKHSTVKSIVFENFEEAKEFEEKHAKSAREENLYSENFEVKEELSLTSMELMLISFLPQNLLSSTLKRKLKFLKEGEAYLQRYIDVYQMIQRFQEIENLKQVLLNNRQISLFNNISKPSIVFDSEALKRIENMRKRPDLFTNEVVETVKGKQKGNLTDSKLLDMLNEGMGHNRFMKESKFH